MYCKYIIGSVINDSAVIEMNRKMKFRLQNQANLSVFLLASVSLDNA